MKYSVAVLALATAVVADYGVYAPQNTYVPDHPYTPDHPYVPDNQWGDRSNYTHYTTYTTTAYTTYCPYATTFTYQEKYYTVTEACTYTITDCPCTVTEPVLKPSTVLYTSCPPTETYKPAPPYTPITYTNTQAAVTTAEKPAQFTGAANANKAGGVMVGAIAGLAALVL